MSDLFLLEFFRGVDVTVELLVVKDDVVIKYNRLAVLAVLVPLLDLERYALS